MTINAKDTRRKTCINYKELQLQVHSYIFPDMAAVCVYTLSAAGEVGVSCGEWVSPCFTEVVLPPAGADLGRELFGCLTWADTS